MQRKVYIIPTLILSLFISFQNADAGKIHKRKIKKLFKHSQLMNSHLTGFALYDRDNKKWYSN